MKITYKIGSLIDAPEAVIAHGCNAQGVMGSGVAKAIRDKFPLAYNMYRRQYESPEQLQLGRIVWAQCGDKLIANCITQENYGRNPNHLYVDYGAIRLCIRAINLEGLIRKQLHMNPIDQEPFDSFALPKIGAGLGGGQWTEISKIIEEETTHIQPVVYVLDDSELEN